MNHTIETRRHRWVPVEACDVFIEECGELAEGRYTCRCFQDGLEHIESATYEDGEWYPEPDYILNPHLGPIPDVEER